ncbi:MAG: choice-of-anchor J domain-containing protein [Chitinophagales bacterium]|nr:choice-of-anchor J domain-containing protein [Chitinophagales bacterium]
MNPFKRINLHALSFLLLFLCAGFFAKAQSPRLQLFEYFDNTSIPVNIGAVAKANYTSLANANPDKFVTIQYHVAWGSETGTDPMNLHNPAQVQTRVTYYNVTADPHGIQDGGDSTLGVFRGQPANFAQSFIDVRDSATSPFSIVVSHSLNPAQDSIRCHAVIKVTGTATSGLKAHVVVIEKQIRFVTAPDVSGETYFENVMKRMLPNDQGTTLPAMNIGDSVVLDLKWKLANVYDTTQLAVVCFVQDAATREVHQAGYSAPQLQANDAGTESLAATDFSCDSITPQVVLFNGGINALLSCTINYQVDNGTPVSVPWIGNLASGASASVTLPALYASGYHLLKVFPTNPNGSPDPVHFNDTTATYFSHASAPASDSIAEGFVSAFSPADWGIGNPQGNGTWEKTITAGGFGNSANSALLEWYNLPAGNTDDLYAPALDFESADSASLEFSVAYARYDGVNLDTLQVRVSTDCGMSWTTVYSKSSTTLATAPDNTDAFTPTASQWRHEAVDLTTFTGEPNVLVQFHGICGYGNNLYLDDINIGIMLSTGIEPAVANRVAVFPNPFSNELTFSTTGNAPSEILLYDFASKKMLQQAFTSVVSISTAKLPVGIYLYEVRDKNGVIEKGKVVKQ